MAAPTPDDALNYAKRFIGNQPVDDTTIKLRLLNDANCQLWMAAPWQWSVGVFEEVGIINNQQDFTVGTYTTFLNFLHAHWTDGQTKKDLQIAAALPSTTSINGSISQIAYIAGSPNKVRFYPVPAGYASNTKVNALYKKTAPVIDGTNEATSYNTTTGVHDEWFWVFQEIVLLKAYQFTKDAREGTVQAGANGIQYTGQHAKVQAAIAAMMQGEEKFWKTLGEQVGNG